MNGKVLPNFPFVPYQDGIEFYQVGGAFFHLPKICSGASFGASQAGCPAGRIHFFNGLPGRLNLEQLAAAVRFRPAKTVGQLDVILEDLRFGILLNLLVHINCTVSAGL